MYNYGDITHLLNIGEKYLHKRAPNRPMQPTASREIIGILTVSAVRSRQLMGRALGSALGSRLAEIEEASMNYEIALIRYAWGADADATITPEGPWPPAVFEQILASLANGVCAARSHGAGVPQHHTARVFRRRQQGAGAAVLSRPLVRLNSASSPSAVLEPGYPPSGAGESCASAVGENAKHANPSVANAR